MSVVSASTGQRCERWLSSRITSLLTAVGNDFGFETIFECQVEALGQPGDLLLGISTSGNSKNIIRALERARSQQMTTLG